jgi:hypothetical protein
VCDEKSHCHSSSQLERNGNESRSKSFLSFITHQPQFKTLNQNESHAIKCRDVVFALCVKSSSPFDFRFSRRRNPPSRVSYHSAGLDTHRSQCIRQNWRDKE